MTANEDRLETRPTHPPHLLVVNGDDELLDRSRIALEEAGYRVSTADLPDIGLVRRVQPDAIVLGLLYRGRATGLDFLDRHTADPTTAIVPVIVYATQAEVDDGQWRHLAGFGLPMIDPAADVAELLISVRATLARATNPAAPGSASPANAAA